MFEKTVVKLLKKLVARLPSRTVTDLEGRPYLTRWYLWPRGPRDNDDEGHAGKSPIAFFVHLFHRSDADRDQHNHPWIRSVAIILAGGYFEQRGVRWRSMGPGSINVIRGNDFHRVELFDEARGSWSLFIAGRKTSGWGFKIRETGKVVPSNDYFAFTRERTKMSVKTEEGVITIDGEDLTKLKDHARSELEKMRPPEGTPALSEAKTPWAVICRAHGQVFLTEDEYVRQLSQPDSRWTCPKCGEVVQFDDDNFETSISEVLNES